MTIEETAYSISVHYRQVNPVEYHAVEAMLDSIMAKYEGLRKTEGKKVFEARLDIDWNKGKAIEYILSKNASPHLPLEDIFVIYIGDDITDEYGFESVNKYPHHLSVIVSPDEDIGRPTMAEYRLSNPTQVRQFLQTLIQLSRDSE